MALLDILRAAIPAVAAARGGYVQGQRQQEADVIARDEKRQAQARQSRLDQIKQALDQANANEANAHADAYRAPKPVSPVSPHTLQTDKGILQWDATTGQWQPTGYRPPAPRPRASDDPTVLTDRRNREGRLRTKTALDATHAQLKSIGPDLLNAQADLKDAKTGASALNPGQVGESGSTTAGMSTRIGQLIQQRAALQRDTDSLTASLKSPENAARYDPVQKRFRPLVGY